MGSAAGSGRKVLAVPHPLFAARAAIARRPRLGTVSARVGGEGGEGEGGGCEGKGERGGEGRVSVTRSTWGTLRVSCSLP